MNPLSLYVQILNAVHYREPPLLQQIDVKQEPLLGANNCHSSCHTLGNTISRENFNSGFQSFRLVRKTRFVGTSI